MSTASNPTIPAQTIAAVDDDGRRNLRRGVYAILIALSVGAMTGRVLAVNSVDLARLEGWLKDQGRENWQKQRPFLSSNDRSRWLTVRALVEKGTYQIDEFVTDPLAHPNWDSIDVVMHQDAGGVPHLYSSKPPLLATLYAGPYWLIHRATGATLGTHPYEIDRGMLLLVNVLPLGIALVLLAGLVERFGRTDWGRTFVMGAATFATFLTTFAVVLNNHVPAAVCATVTLYAGARIWYEGERRLRYFAVTGLFAALSAACELPALALFSIVSAALLWKAPRQTLVAYLPAALVVVVAFFATNWIAHQSLRPPYAHRHATEPGQNWYDYQFTRTDGTVVESYWRQPVGVDRGEASPARYVLNVLVGHHGIFSLTPIWLLAVPGVLILGWGRQYRLRAMAIGIATVTVVCVGFYLLMPQTERNYGGMTSGFRWVFWFTPLWLVAVLPTADALAPRRWGRWLGYLLLGLSVLSASYPVWNPWTHPWLWNLWSYLGWPTM